MFGKHATTTAVSDSFSSLCERSRQRRGSLAVALQQMKRDSLCRFPADTGHASECIDQADKYR
jgi:hypothetical protein